MKVRGTFGFGALIVTAAISLSPQVMAAPQTGIASVYANGDGHAWSKTANGERVTFHRDPGNVTMDLHGVERIQFEALGGTDNVVVNDLSGTDVKQVAIDLAAVPGTTTGDGQPDTVTVNATDGGADGISVVSSGSSVVVNGLSEQVTIDGAEAANDSLTIKGLGGNDTIDASGLNAGQIKLVIDGGDGNDTIIGTSVLITAWGRHPD
jgi:hypothetical protein